MRACAPPPFAVAEAGAKAGVRSADEFADGVGHANADTAHAKAAADLTTDLATDLTTDARWRAHDLLRLARLPAYENEPPWVREAWARAPFVVVRRALAATGFVAVGVRGSARAQRYGTWAETADIEASIAPEDLLHVAPVPTRRALPPMRALVALRSAASPLASFVWGPTGSSGFELATGMPCVTEASDLDLLVRTPQRLACATARDLQAALAEYATHAGLRIDVQIETPMGGVALAELAMSKPRVLVRDPAGARLVADPWALPAETA